MTDTLVTAVKLERVVRSLIEKILDGEDHIDQIVEARSLLAECQGLAVFVEAEKPPAEPIAYDLIQDKTELHEDKFVVFRNDQLEGSYVAGGRRLTSFIEEYDSIEEAYAAANATDKEARPIYVGSIFSSNDELLTKVEYILTKNS